LLPSRRDRDGLTGAPNRKRFFLDLHSTLQTRKPFALVLANVDEFRKVNEAFGHELANNVLCTMATAFAKRCAESGVRGPYRDGGDSFSFLVVRHIERAFEFAEALRTDVQQMRFPAHPVCRVTIRLAVATSPADGIDAGKLRDKVHHLVYGHQQERKRNQVISSTD
jgi:diguanylate cyclase (GGDEF)-like protein